MGSQTSVLLCVDKAGPNEVSHFLCEHLNGLFSAVEFHLGQRIRPSNHSSKVSDVFLLSQIPTKKDIYNSVFIAKMHHAWCLKVIN